MPMMHIDILIPFSFIRNILTSSQEVSLKYFSYKLLLNKNLGSRAVPCHDFKLNEVHNNPIAYNRRKRSDHLMELKNVN